jgi:hypothetical protein
LNTLFGDALPVSLDAQLAEVEREIKLRSRVYPRWVEKGNLTQTAADRQLEIMRAVADSLRQLKEVGP